MSDEAGPPARRVRSRPQPDGPEPETVRVNERFPPGIDGLFVSLGKFEFIKEQPAIVEVSNDKTDGHVIVDSVQWVIVE